MLMNICIISYVYPFPERGYFPGIERVVSNHAQRLSERGHNVSVITTYRNGDEKHTSDGDVKIHRVLDSREMMGKIGSVFAIDRLSFAIAAKTTSTPLSQYDLIHTHSPLVLPPREVPLVAHHHHWKEYDGLKDYLWLPMVEWQWMKTYDHAKKIITVSDYSKSRLAARGVEHNKIKTLYHGVNTKQFKKDGAILKDNYDCEHIVLYVGPLIKRKGLDTLIDAFALLREQMDTVELVIVGDGDQEKYREMAESEGIGDVVHFVGFVQEELLPQYYRTADLFVLPSRLEGFGQVLLEAMASGTPVIGTNTTSIPEVVGEAGILIEPNNSNVLEENMRKLLEDERLSRNLSMQGMKRVSEIFSWEVQLDSLENLYHQLISSNNISENTR